MSVVGDYDPQCLWWANMTHDVCGGLLWPTMSVGYLYDSLCYCSPLVRMWAIITHYYSCGAFRPTLVLTRCSTSLQRLCLQLPLHQLRHVIIFIRVSQSIFTEVFYSEHPASGLRTVFYEFCVVFVAYSTEFRLVFHFEKSVGKDEILVKFRRTSED